MFHYISDDPKAQLELPKYSHIITEESEDEPTYRIIEVHASWHQMLSQFPSHQHYTPRHPSQHALFQICFSSMPNNLLNISPLIEELRL